MRKLNARAVIFDLGSTLIEYEAVSWDELNVLCAASARRFLIAQGYDVPPEDQFFRLFELTKESYRKAASESLVEWNVPQVSRIVLDALGIRTVDGLIDQLFDAYYAPVDQLLYIYPDTIETLTRLHERGFKIGLISNTVFPERAHQYELRRFGIAPYLQFSIFSSTFGLRKPHADIFRHACELAGQSPSDCLYVGDRYVEDIRGPRGIGMSAILKIKPGREYPAEMPEAERRIDHLSELFEHIQI